MGICDRWSIDPPGIHIEPPDLHYERPLLFFEPLKLLNFYFNVGPDPAFHSNADPEPDPALKILLIHADPDPQPCLR
jgi:hypothetical protein